MPLTPDQAPEILVHNRQPDAQAENEIERTADASMPSQVTVGDHTQEIRKLKLAVAHANLRVNGLKKLRSDDNKKVLNPNWEDIERELWIERDSNPKTNYIQNGGFRQWDAGLTLPTGWTASGSPTITRVAARTGAQGGNYGVQLVAGGSEGSISRVFRVKPSDKYKVAGFVKMAASAAVTVTLTTDGVTPVVVTSPGIITNSRFGTDWLGFPRQTLDIIDIETPVDATQITIKLAVDANHTAIFSDFQSVQGPRCDANRWEPAPEDIESAPGLPTLPSNASYTPTGTGVLNVTTITPGIAYITKSGNQVHQWGTFTVDPAAAGATTFRLSLMTGYTSNFGAVTDASGGCANAQAVLIGEVSAVAATDDLLVSINSPDGNQRTFQYWVDYIII